MSGIDWAKIRKLWEQDSRDGAAWLVKEYNLPMTRQAVQNKIRSQKWTKTVSPVSVSHRRETEKQRNEKQKRPKTVARQKRKGWKPPSLRRQNLIKKAACPKRSGFSFRST